MSDSEDADYIFMIESKLDALKTECANREMEEHRLKDLCDRRRAQVEAQAKTIKELIDQRDTLQGEIMRNGQLRHQLQITASQTESQRYHEVVQTRDEWKAKAERLEKVLRRFDEYHARCEAPSVRADGTKDDYTICIVCDMGQAGYSDKEGHHDNDCPFQMAHEAIAPEGEKA